jgi:hypothetical protein
MAQRILIADDEENIVISLEFLMKREGFEVLDRSGRRTGAGDDPRRASGPGAARRHDAEKERLRGLPGGQV